MIDSDSLSGATAVITGASSGIGEATAHALAREGVDVALAARREEQLRAIAEDLESEFDAEALVVPTDVTDEDAVADLFDETVSAFGEVNVVVVNAGLGMGGDVAEMDTDTYRTMMDVNVDGAFFTAREAIPHLTETSGNLVFVASFAGKFPRPGNPVYAGTKWWVRGFANSLAGQIGDDDVGVTMVNPSEVRTEFGNEEDEAFEEAFEEGEVTEPEEVAEAIAFAAAQEPPTTIGDIDVYRRDKFSHF